MAKNAELSNQTPRRPHAIAFDPADSMTEQSHKSACDINNIMARYTKTGTLDHVRRYEGQYLDIPPGDFQEAENRVAEAKSMFEELPSQVRLHFSNDTSKFLEFCATQPNPPAQLAAIAEEYRKQALGVDARDRREQKQSGKDAAPDEGGKTDSGMNQASPAENPDSGSE